jgi:hypothetical protein
MRRIIVTAAILSTTVLHAAAATENYRDLVRPHGHKRSAAVYQADLDACYRQVGSIRDFPDTPTFKACMLGRGYRWMSITQDPPTQGLNWTDFLPCCGQ